MSRVLHVTCASAAMPGPAANVDHAGSCSTRGHQSNLLKSTSRTAMQTWKLAEHIVSTLLTHVGGTRPQQFILKPFLLL